MTGIPTSGGPVAPAQPAPPAQPRTAEPAGGRDREPSRWNETVREIMSGSVVISILAVVLALVVGAILIAATDPTVQHASSYFFARPGDTFSAIWSSVSNAYVSMFQGAIYNFRRPSFAAGIRPLTETLTFATPLIVSGLGVALAFRVGLFNIGGQGQLLIAAAAAAWVGFSFSLPPVVHLVLAIVAGIAGGAIWAGIVGLLKARTGAHEVIVTIMLNYIAFYLISYMLRTQGLLQAPGSSNPKAPPVHANAVFPPLFGDQYNVTWAFVLVIAATVVVWWLINRSGLGFRFRAVGENPNAARVAGINVKNVYVYAMLIAGGLVGIAGASQALGVFPQGISSGVDAGIGFDAITVALLGRSRPGGVFIAGLLFGALKAGGYTIQAANDIPIDIVLILQSLIVLFVAAPPLVRAIFRLPAPGTSPRRPRPIVTKEVEAK